MKKDNMNKRGSVGRLPDGNSAAKNKTATVASSAVKPRKKKSAAAVTQDSSSTMKKRGTKTPRTAKKAVTGSSGVKPEAGRTPRAESTKKGTAQKPPVQKNSTAKTARAVPHSAPVPAKKSVGTKKVSGAKRASRTPLRVISLGGLQEIGKNMTVLEYGDDMIVIDAGMGFPDEDMLGIDLVIPDLSYLVKNAHKIRGVLITHGHEDHIGGVPYLLKKINVPIYGTRLSLGIIAGKLEENPPPNEAELYTVEAGDTVNLGVFRAEFIHVNHSIADACAIAVKTPVGTVIHTGDFKLDVSPLDGRIMDITRLGELGREGVELLLCESTNAERGGFTPSERTVGSSLERLFAQYEKRRLIVATFSSNIHRVQQIIDCSARHGRHVAVLGRSMVNVIGAAAELGYIDLPEGVLIDVSEIKKYSPEQITLITTGSQGEPMSALYRIAHSEHDKVKITPNDVVVLSSSAIPGNEKLVGKIINALVKNGVRVVNDSVEEIHVSGHACREEIKLMMALTSPKYLMPIHGEYRHLFANKEIGEFMGIPSQNIFVSEVGRVLELDGASAKFTETVPAGNVLVDGAGVGDIGSVVLRDRRHLAEDGLVVVVATVDSYLADVVAGPDIVSRGFVYVKESEELMDGARDVVVRTIRRTVGSKKPDYAFIKSSIREELARYIFTKTRRKPMILPIIMEL